MPSSDDERLDALFPDPPWRLPGAIAAPATGDAALDALLASLDRPLTEANAIDAAKKSLLEDTRGALIHPAVEDWLERITAELAIAADPLGGVTLDPALLVRARALVAASRTAWTQRTWLAQNLVALYARNADAWRTMLRWLERPTDARVTGALGTALIASLPSEARTQALDAIGAHLLPGDRIAPFAAEAIVIRDGDAARPAIASALAGADDYLRATIVVRVANRPEIDLDATPDWVDVLYPNVLGKPWAIAASYRFHTTKTAEPILRALGYTAEEPYWADLLARLREIDDPSSAPRLEAIAATLPDAPKGKRLQRSKATVLALVKHLRRKRDVVTKASFTLGPGVGTDGGPILVVSKDAAKAWRGVPADWNGSGDSDYDRACASSEDGVGALTIDGRASIVIDEQAAQIAKLADGSVLLLLHGTDLQIEGALAESRAWKKTKLALEVAEGGSVVLDATRTLAAAEDDAVAELPLAPGRYEVIELRRDEAAGAVRALKLMAAVKRRRK